MRRKGSIHNTQMYDLPSGFTHNPASYCRQPAMLDIFPPKLLSMSSSHHQVCMLDSDNRWIPSCLSILIPSSSCIIEVKPVALLAACQQSRWSRHIGVRWLSTLHWPHHVGNMSVCFCLFMKARHWKFGNEVDTLVVEGYRTRDSW